MCTKKDIGDILKQIEDSQNTEHKRRLLEEANLTYARDAPRVYIAMDQIAVVVSISGLNFKTIHIL
ncbi:MAG: hypothetical protein WC256_00990 [Desulfurivibrionaceae bacterium]|jgi:hypothetical protein